MLDPNKKCAVFLDIDNTLTGERFVISRENHEAMAKAREKGHLIFINTGRSWANIPQILLDQLDVDGFVAGSGASVVMNGKMVFKTSIRSECVLKLAKYVFANKKHWMVAEGLKRNYAVTNNIKIVDPWQIPLDSIEDFARYLSDDEIQVIALDSSVPENIVVSFADELSFFAMGHYYDCVSKGHNKATGMKKVIELTGVRSENTIAIGDGGNDIDMIRAAGIGVAVKNAQPDIIEAADYITESNLDHGVAKAIEKFLL